MWKYNLLQQSWIRILATSHWPLLILRASTLGGFVFAILVGIYGTPVGNRNFAIIAVWIAWWAALMLVIVPFLGRGWCAVCPIPMPGEWLQNGAVLGPIQNKKKRKSFRRFPKLFRNIWLQNGAFTLLALFSTVILTRPSVTAWVLLGMILSAVGLSLIFERRSFCRYVCPVGGFIGLYSKLAPVELRVIDTQVCKAHSKKSCYQGSENGYGCPWNIYPGGMIPGIATNTNCGLCMECLRTCDYDNIALNLRAFGADIHPKNKAKLDEAYKAFIMLGSALVYSAVMLGPWGGLKNAAYQVGSLPWFSYGVTLLTLTWGLLPGLFYVATRTAQVIAPTNHNTRQIFTSHSAALLPLGFAAWVAFSFSFVFANISYLWPVLSDPFGWGWNLFGTVDLPWTPYLGSLIPSLQVPILIGGLVWSGFTTKKIAVGLQAHRQFGPVMVFSLLITLLFLWLLVA
jgi:polyferredoxin